MIHVLAMLAVLPVSMSLHIEPGRLMHQHQAAEISSRRSLMKSSVLAATGLWSSRAQAQPSEFAGVDTQAPPPDGEAPFVTLPNGVRVKQFKQGSGDASAKEGSTVGIQCSGRLLNLNGVSFYNTKNNNPDNMLSPEPLVFTIGKGAALPGLEEGIVGMKKGEIRRIIVPSDLGYSKYPNLEPQPTTTLDQRALDSVVKNPRRDATLVFDVKLEKLK